MKRVSAAGLLMLVLLGLSPTLGDLRAEDEMTLLRLVNLAGEARALEGQGRYVEAHAKAAEALGLSERALGPTHTATVTTRILVGQLLIRLGRYAESREHLEQGLGEAQALAFMPALVRAIATYDLGDALLHLEEYSEAGRLLTEAHRQLVAIHGEEHLAPAACLVSLGRVVAAQGAPLEGLRLCDEGLAILGKIVPETDMRRAVSLSNRGMILEALGRHEKARASYEEALALHGEEERDEHPEAILTTGNLARLLYYMGKSTEARPLYERVLAHQEQHLGPDHPEVAYTLGNLGALLGQQGHPEEARICYERAVRICEESVGAESPRTRQVQSNFASFLLWRQRFAEAATLMARCLDGTEQSVRTRLVSMQTHDRLRLAAAQRGYLVNWWRLLSWMGESGYEEVLRFKGLIRRAMAAERRVVRHGDPALTDRIEALRSSDLALSRLANRIPPGFRKEERASWSTAYETATKTRDRLASELARDVASVREGTDRLGLTLADVQRELAPGQVLLDYLVTGDIYQVWIVAHEGAARRVELGSATEIDEAARAFGALAAAPTTDDEDKTWRREGQELKNRMLGPVLPHLPAKTHTLVISPDAALTVVPLGALPGEEESRSLLDDYLLVQVTMAQDLVPWPNAPASGKGALVIGDVDYAKATPNPDGVAVVPSRGGSTRHGRASAGRQWGDLPQTAEEAEFVASKLGRPSTKLTGTNATEARFRTEAPGRRWIHVASHGYADPDDSLAELLRGPGRAAAHPTLGLGGILVEEPDPLLLGGLALAGANCEEGAHGDDGHLTALEVSYLDLEGVDLVVLSACQTALGHASSGEGVLGLVQAFQMAGARGVLGSLWCVNDEATRLLMQHFYEQLEAKNGNAAEALREAQRRLRDTEGEDGTSRPYADPYYWAGWSLWSTAAGA